MPREILFRGKRVDNGEWVYGYYYYDIKHKTHVIIYQEEFQGKIYSYERIIDPKTLGQYIGIEDDSGENQKIFEDDILELYDYHWELIYEKSTVVYQAECSNYPGFDLDNDHGSDRNLIFDYKNGGKILVIGNIHGRKND